MNGQPSNSNVIVAETVVSQPGSVLEVRVLRTSESARRAINRAFDSGKRAESREKSGAKSEPAAK